MDKYIAAIDGGATKTDMVLCTIDGRVLNRVIGGPTNPNDIGFERSIEYLKEMLIKLLENYRGLKLNLYSFYAGLSGGSVGNNKERYSVVFKEMLVNTSHIYNGSDAINALNSGIGCDDGMVLIAGTGSVVFVRKNDEIAQIGGWGYLIDDAGSGYDIGRRGFLAALRDYDGRGESTLLYDLYNHRLGGPVYKCIPEVYQKGKQFIASFAPLVFEAETKGDRVAGLILNDCAAELALLVEAGARHLKGSNDGQNATFPKNSVRSDHNINFQMTDYHRESQHTIKCADETVANKVITAGKIKYQVVLTGGLWKSGDALMKRFKSNLSQDFVLIQPELPPVYGAVVEALDRVKKKCIISVDVCSDVCHDGCQMPEKCDKTKSYLRTEIDGGFYDNFKNTLKQNRPLYMR